MAEHGKKKVRRRISRYKNVPVIKDSISEENKNTIITSTELLKLTVALRSRYVTHFVETAMETKNTRMEIVKRLASELGKRPNNMMSKEYGDVSVLMKKDFDHMEETSMAEIVQEMASKFPELYSILLNIMIPSKNADDPVKKADIIPRMAMVYSILMQTRHHEFSRLQRVIAMCLMDNLCEQQVGILGACLSLSRDLNFFICTVNPTSIYSKSWPK